MRRNSLVRGGLISVSHTQKAVYVHQHTNDFAHTSTFSVREWRFCRGNVMLTSGSVCLMRKHTGVISVDTQGTEGRTDTHTQIGQLKRLIFNSNHPQTVGLLRLIHHVSDVMLGAHGHIIPGLSPRQVSLLKLM